MYPCFRLSVLGWVMLFLFSGLHLLLCCRSVGRSRCRRLWPVRDLAFCVGGGFSLSRVLVFFFFRLEYIYIRLVYIEWKQMRWLIEWTNKIECREPDVEGESDLERSHNIVS